MPKFFNGNSRFKFFESKIQRNSRLKILHRIEPRLSVAMFSLLYAPTPAKVYPELRI